jgi:hypothetical protein
MNRKNRLQPSFNIYGQLTSDSHDTVNLYNSYPWERVYRAVPQKQSFHIGLCIATPLVTSILYNNIITVALRGIGGDKKGSLESEIVKYNR